MAEGRRVLINDPHRFEGVAVIGVDEHCWRHTRRGDKFVMVIIDLTPVRDQSGPARLLDMVEGRSKAVFKTWLDAQSAAFRAGVEVVAMDGFTGFKTAAAETVPDAVAVMDPFHVVALAGDNLVQAAFLGVHRPDPLCRTQPLHPVLPGADAVLRRPAGNRTPPPRRGSPTRR